MSREIKFRVFDSISETLHSWDSIKDIPLPEFDLEHYTLEQFTGLKDKHGVDIYEGDFLKVTSEYLVKCGFYDRNLESAARYRKKNYAFYEVFFHDNDCCDSHIGFQMCRRHTVGADGEVQGFVKFKPEITKNCEVIGNIHENADLIK